MLTNRSGRGRSSRSRRQGRIINCINVTLFLLIRVSFPDLTIPSLNTNTRACRRSIITRIHMITRRLQCRRSSLLIQILISNSKRRRTRMITYNLITRQHILSLSNSTARLQLQRRMSTPFLTTHRSRSHTGLKARLNERNRTTLHISFQNMHTRRRQKRNRQLQLYKKIHNILSLQIIYRHSASWP